MPDMFSLTQTTGYAIRALGCLDDGKDQYLQAGQIATCTGIPLPYLSKILSELTRAGFVEGKRGYRGGFRLTRPAGAIPLAEVAASLEGDAWLGNCLLGLEACTPQDPCPAHACGESLRAALLEEFRRLSVADMARYEQRASSGRIGCCCPDQKSADAPEVLSGDSKPTATRSICPTCT